MLQCLEDKYQGELLNKQAIFFLIKKYSNEKRQTEYGNIWKKTRKEQAVKVSEPFSIAFNWSPYLMEKSEWEEFFEKGDIIFEN